MSNRNIKRLVYRQYGQYSLTFRALGPFVSWDQRRTNARNVQQTLLSVLAQPDNTDSSHGALRECTREKGLIFDTTNCVPEPVDRFTNTLRPIRNSRTQENFPSSYEWIFKWLQNTFQAFTKQLFSYRGSVRRHDLCICNLIVLIANQIPLQKFGSLIGTQLVVSNISPDVKSLYYQASISSTPTFLYFGLYLYSAYMQHTIHACDCMVNYHVYIRLCKYSCNVTAYFPVLFYKRNRKWREFGRIGKYLCNLSRTARVHLNFPNEPKATQGGGGRISKNGTFTLLGKRATTTDDQFGFLRPHYAFRSQY